MGGGGGDGDLQLIDEQTEYVVVGFVDSTAVLGLAVVKWKHRRCAVVEGWYDSMRLGLYWTS